MKKETSKNNLHLFPYISIIYGYIYITNSQYDHLTDGLIAQLVEHCTGTTEVMGSNSIEA